MYMHFPRSDLVNKYHVMSEILWSGSGYTGCLITDPSKVEAFYAHLG